MLNYQEHPVARRLAIERGPHWVACQEDIDPTQAEHS